MQNIKSIPNGTHVKNTFSDAEYTRRVDCLRRAMDEDEIDVALFTSIHGINYYSDFLYCSFGRPYGLVVTGAKVVSILANIDGGQPWRRTVGENIVYTDWQRDNYFHAVQQVIPGKSVVGIEFDHVNLENMEKLRIANPGCSFKDISKTTMRLRMVKSDEEIAHIKQGAEVCDIGGEALVAAVHDGVAEHEVALESTRAMVREIARRYPHSELMDTWTWFQSGINTDGAHNPVTTRNVQKGDILSLNCFSMMSRLLHRIGTNFIF